jgi:hypothetical protein
MQLELATVLSCHPEGCLVLPVGQATPLTARYAAAVKDRIRIRRSEVVVIDQEGIDVELVWRWRVGEVLRPVERAPAPDHVLVGTTCHIIEARIAQGGLDVVPGDHVCVEHVDDAYYVLDRVNAGGPEHPAWIKRERFPSIEAAYAAMNRS